MTCARAAWGAAFRWLSVVGLLACLITAGTGRWSTAVLLERDGGSVVIRVSPSGNDANDGSSWPLAKRTIQGAVSSSVPPGTDVWVAAGVYPEHVELAPDVQLLGGFAGNESSPEQRDWEANQTIIDGSGSGPCVSARDIDAVVDGFVIRNTGSSAGLDTVRGFVRVSNNVFTNCYRGVDGTNGAIDLVGNTFEGNSEGISITYSALGFYNNTVRRNQLGLDIDGTAIIANNVIVENFDGVSLAGSGSRVLVNNTIANNIRFGINCESYSRDNTIVNNIVAFSQRGIVWSGTAPTLRNNDVFANARSNYDGPGGDPTGANGNISVDPVFASKAYGNYHLQPESPCRESGNNSDVIANYPDIDGQPRIQGQSVDMGADESDGTTWAVTPVVIRVSPHGNDANDGSSWALAKRSVQGAVVSAPSTGADIWVATGVYPEYVSLQPYVHLFGGFAGTEEARSERDWLTNETIIDGSSASPCVSIRLAAGTVDGFTLRNAGNANAAVEAYFANFVVTHNRITANAYRGISSHYSTVEVLANTLVDNDALATIYGESSTLHVYGNVFRRNTGIAIEPTSYCTTLIANNVIAEGLTGISIQDIGYNIIVNNTIVGNCWYGLYISPSGDSTYLLANNIIAHNRAGIRTTHALLTMRNNDLFGNGLNYSGPGGDPTGVNGNISADPLFASRWSGDLHVQPDSPCRESGNNSDVIADYPDIDGQPRIQGQFVDIGADESDGTIWNPTVVVIRVSTTGDDANDGSSWNLAKRTVQGAVSSAPTGGAEVWVAAGVYNEIISLKPYVHLYGGFNGTEASRFERSWLLNETALASPNAQPTVSCKWLTASVDGFMFRESVSSNPIKVDNATFAVSNCRFLGSQIAYMTVTSSIAEVFGNVFERKSIVGSYSNLTLFNNVLRNGSAVVANFCHTRMANNLVVGCGGLKFDSGSLSLINNTIVANTAYGVRLTSVSPATMANNIVAYNPKGFEVYSGSLKYRNNDVFGNGVNFDGSFDPTGTNGNVSVNPGLEGPAHGFQHLSSNSPCRDAGNLADVQSDWLDIDFQPRIHGIQVDIGADEFGAFGASDQTELTAVPHAVPADGLTAATLTLKYTSPDGIPMAGRFVRFLSDRPSDLFEPLLVQTDEYGIARSTIRSGAPGIATLTCQDEATNLRLEVLEHISFFPSESERPVLELVQSAVPANTPCVEGLPIPNKVTARVTWPGQPGSVVFDLNGKRFTVPATGPLVSMEFDFGSDLDYSARGAWNELRVTALDPEGIPSATYHPMKWMGIELPPCLREAYWDRTVPGENPRVEIALNGRLEATMVVEWPVQATNGVASIPSSNPLLRDSIWGIESSKFNGVVKLRLEPLPDEQADVQGSVTFSAAAVALQPYDRLGSGPKHTIRLVNLGTAVSGTAEAEILLPTPQEPRIHLSDLTVPMLLDRTVETPDLWTPIAVAVPALVPVDPILDLVASFGFETSGGLHFRDDVDRFVYTEGTQVLTPTGKVSFFLKPGLRQWLTTGLQGGISAPITLEYPNAGRQSSFAGNDFLYETQLNLWLTGFVRSSIWFLDYVYSWENLQQHWSYPEVSGDSSPFSKGSPSIQPDNRARTKGVWRRPSRSYFNGPLRYDTPSRSEPSPPSDSSEDGGGGWLASEQLLRENTYPHAHPTLAWLDGRGVVAYDIDRSPELPSHQATEIRSYFEGPGGWSDAQTIDVTDDTALDSQPMLAIDSANRLVCVWTRIEGAPETTIALDRYRKAEIAYSVFDAGSRTWSQPALVTSDDLVDLHPKLVKGGDGFLYLVWLKSPDNVIPDAFESPITPHTDIWMARWTGSGFTDIQLARSRADSTEPVGLAVSTGSQPMLVWSRDADGQSSTPDQRVLYSLWNGQAWSDPAVVTGTDVLSNSNPKLSLATGDLPVLFFARSEVPHPTAEGHTVEELYATSYTAGAWSEPSRIASATLMGELDVIATPEGKVSAIWGTSSPEGADLWTTVYDALSHTYNAPIQLTNDLGQETQLSAGWDPAGNPAAVYIKRNREMRQVEVRDAHGVSYYLDAAVRVEDHQADLYLLTHQPQVELELLDSDVSVTPANAGPGKTAVLSAIVHNRGAAARTASGAVRVGFFDGNPTRGGTLIEVVSLPMTGGSSGVASIEWVVPKDGLRHTVWAVADVYRYINEPNESNNSGKFTLIAPDLAADPPIMRQSLGVGALIELSFRNPSSVSVSGTVHYELWRGQPESGVLLTEGDALPPEPGSRRTIPFQWDTSGMTAGAYDLWLVIDPDDLVLDAERTNNTAKGTVHLLADLAVNPADATFHVADGRIGVVGVTVFNQGWVSAENVTVEVLDRDPAVAKARVLGSSVIPLLDRGANTRVSIQATLPPPFGASQSLWVVVNRGGGTLESRTDNNTLSFALSPFLIKPQAVLATVGQLVSGGTGELARSDDAYVVLAPSAEGVSQAELTGFAPFWPPANLELFVEAHTTIQGLAFSVELWDWVAERWTVLETSLAEQSDKEYQFSLRNLIPERWVDPATKTVRARLTWSPTGPPSSGWQVKIDRVVWRIWP